MAGQRDRLARAAAASVSKGKRPPPGPPNFPTYVPRAPGQVRSKPLRNTGPYFIGGGQFGPKPVRGNKITEDDPRWRPPTKRRRTGGT